MPQASCLSSCPMFMVHASYLRQERKRSCLSESCARFGRHELSKPGARYDRRCFSESCLSVASSGTTFIKLYIPTTICNIICRLRLFVQDFKYLIAFVRRWNFRKTYTLHITYIQGICNPYKVSFEILATNSGLNEKSKMAIYRGVL